MNTALKYSTRVVQEGGRRCKKSTLTYLEHLTPLRIPLMNPPINKNQFVQRLQRTFGSCVVLANHAGGTIWNDIARNCLLGNGKKIAKCLMRTFTCRSTFLYVLRPLARL
jgi:hypothetical protein